MANDDEILKKELIKLNKNFFEKYQLKIETRNMIRLCSTMILHRWSKIWKENFKNYLQNHTIGEGTGQQPSI